MLMVMQLDRSEPVALLLWQSQIMPVAAGCPHDHPVRATGQ
jgi:hypothetical protein